jgi:glyoxylase-like metal-dependent hydrolase (beta-lactamase superfamily II)
MRERRLHPKRSTIGTALLLALCLGTYASGFQRPASAGGPTSAGQGELSKLAEGVFAQIVNADGDAVSNSGVVILDSGVLVFDTHYTPEAGEALLEKITAATARPVRYIVNSHFHPDHTHGNQAFSTVRQIIGSTNTRRDMLAKDLPALNQTQAIVQSQVVQLSKDLSSEHDARAQAALRAQLNERQAFMRRMSSIRILAPVMTFDDNLTIVDGDRSVQLLYLGKAHTDGDSVLYLPQEKIAFLGDIFFHDAIPNVEDASILEWMKTLQEVLKLDARTFVPGHGQVGARTDVEGFLNYFGDLKALVEPAVAHGESLEQLLGEVSLPVKYSSYSFQKFFPDNVQKLYAEIKAGQPGPTTQETVKK